MNAKERFEETRRAVVRLNDVQALIMYDCDDWKPPGVKAKTSTADPTANQAIYNVDELDDKLTALRSEESELIKLIGESLAIIDAVKRGFGEIYGNLLEWRYIDRWTWKLIHEERGITRDRGRYLIEVACDWVDSVGVSRLLSGGEIEL